MKTHLVVPCINRGFALLTTCCCYCIYAESSHAQTNSWTNSASGYWEENHWSAGLLPGTNQTILFTNTWQALAIGANTVQSHPETLKVDAVHVSAPVGTFNELLMNYAGLQNPLVIGSDSGDLMVGSNSAVVMLSSSLRVNNVLGFGGPDRGAFSIGGSFNQGEFSQVSAGFIHVGDIGPGTYNLTNGTLQATEILGAFPATSAAALTCLFNQFGGTNWASLQAGAGSKYNLWDGSFIGDAVCWGGDFFQGNGYFSGSLHLRFGNYSLSGGLLSANDLKIPELPPYPLPQFASGSFLQTGGTNLLTSLFVLSGNAPAVYTAFGSYTLSSGALLVAGAVSILGASFSQSGGVQTNTGISLSGGSGGPFNDRPGQFSIGGGVLLTPSVNIGEGTFAQTAGTTAVSGDILLTGGSSINHAPSRLELSGGVLSAMNTILDNSFGGVMHQSGGTFSISNLLTINRTYPEFDPAENYTLSGGALIVPNILLDAAIFRHAGGAVVNNGTITLGGGTWLANSNTTQLGTLAVKLASNSPAFSNAIVSLPPGNAVLRFADSSGIPWASSAGLTISNWAGAADGNGKHQIIFGSNAAGLTPQQISQFSFLNPGGSSGTFPGAMLATGEIVPARFLEKRVTRGALVLAWANGGTLQSATNVFGPYLDVTGTNPYTNQLGDARRFFRLRN